MADLKIASYNVNGIRAATKKGLLTWIHETAPDLICFQEMRSSEKDMPKELAELDYIQYHQIAQKMLKFPTKRPIHLQNESGDPPWLLKQVLQNSTPTLHGNATKTRFP